MSNTKIFAAGKGFDIGCRVVKWDEPEGFSFYNYKNYFLKRNLSLEELKEKTNSFIYHHSVTYTAKQTFTGLVARRLSVTFIIDDDDVEGYATIYQCLDMKDCGYSHSPLNQIAPGVEISYHPEYYSNANLYSDTNVNRFKVKKHDVVNEVIHNHKMKVFAPTQAQIKSCIALGWGVCDLLDLNPEFPKDQDGQFVKTKLANPEKYKGLMNHFNITRNKIDAAGLPLDEMEAEIKLRYFYRR